MKKFEVRKELADFLKVFNEVTVPSLLANGFKPTPINAREGLANLTSSLTTKGPKIAKILDDIIDCEGFKVPVRIFNPNPNIPLPILIYYHGGGGMGGSVTVYDPILRRLAAKTNHIVIGVEYRLAPENPYPAGEIDAYNVLKNIHKLLDSLNIKYIDKISIGGDSGGGALSTAVIRRAQFDKNVKIEKQFLIYPSVDYTMVLPSIIENANNYLLTASKIKWYFDNYFCNNENRKEASPLYGKFSKNMPETLVFTAQFCPLRDEGIMYYEKIKKQGIYAEFYNLENMIHTFMNMENLCKEECDFVYNKINSFLNR